METLHTIRKWLDKIVGTICILFFALMVVVGSYQIITRSYLITRVPFPKSF